MCGIFAIFNNKYNNNLQELFYSLQKLQHRGKDGYGIVYFHDNSSLITTKGEGELNNELLDRTNNIQLKSCMGHLRYSTSGSTIKNGLLKRTELQPIRGFDEHSHTPLLYST